MSIVENSIQLLPKCTVLEGEYIYRLEDVKPNKKCASALVKGEAINCSLKKEQKKRNTSQD